MGWELVEKKIPVTHSQTGNNNVACCPVYIDPRWKKSWQLWCEIRMHATLESVRLAGEVFPDKCVLLVLVGYEAKNTVCRDACM